MLDAHRGVELCALPAGLRRGSTPRELNDGATLANVVFRLALDKMAR